MGWRVRARCVRHAARQTLTVMARAEEHQQDLLTGVHLRTAINIAEELFGKFTVEQLGHISGN